MSFLHIIKFYKSKPLSPVIYGGYSLCLALQHIQAIDILNISNVTALRWILQDFAEDKSI